MSMIPVGFGLKLCDDCIGLYNLCFVLFFAAFVTFGFLVERTVVCVGFGSEGSQRTCLWLIFVELDLLAALVGIDLLSWSWLRRCIWLLGVECVGFRFNSCKCVVK